MEQHQTPTDEPEAQPNPRSDLLQLVRSLRAHVDELESSGAWGAPSAPPHAVAPRPASTPARSAPPSESSSAAPPLHAAPLPIAAPPSPPQAGRPATSEAADGHARADQRPTSIGGTERPLVHLPLAASGRLQELAKEAQACTRCGLHEARNHSVFSRGTGAAGLAFIGEGPGEEEDRQGLPFVGPAGVLLDRMIAAMQLERDDVYVCNIVKCRPPKNRKPEPEEMSRCMPYLEEQLSIIQPRVIVALGATAVQGLLGTTEGITRLRGQWKLYRGKIPVMPTFHPAYLLRTPTAKRDVWKDLQDVLRRMNEIANPGES